MDEVLIKCGVLTASYQNDGDVRKKMMTQAKNEVAAGKNPNHLILRNGGRLKYNLKFDVPIFISSNGVRYPAPLCTFGLTSMHETLDGPIVTVGAQKTTGKSHHKAISLLNDRGFSQAAGEKKHIFVPEGSSNQWAYSNTIRRAYGLLPEDDQKILLLPADTIFIDVHGLVSDRDVLDNDIVLNLNTKEISGRYFPRNYHYAIIDENGVRHLAKEPNPWIMDLGRIASNPRGLGIFDFIYGARKAYDGKSSQRNALIELLFKEKDADGVYVFSPKVARRSLSELGFEGASEFARVAFRRFLNVPESNDKVLTLNASRVESLISYLMGIPGFKTRVKPSPQPGGIIDIDSLEDLVFVQSMVRLMEDRHENLDTIFPYFNEVKAMACEVKVWGVEMTDYWSEIANRRFKTFRIAANYDRQGRLRQELFKEEQLLGQMTLMQDYWKAKRFSSQFTGSNS